MKSPLRNGTIIELKLFFGTIQCTKTKEKYYFTKNDIVDNDVKELDSVVFRLRIDSAQGNRLCATSISKVVKALPIRHK